MYTYQIIMLCSLCYIYQLHLNKAQKFKQSCYLKNSDVF